MNRLIPLLEAACFFQILSNVRVSYRHAECSRPPKLAVAFLMLFCVSVSSLILGTGSASAQNNTIFGPNVYVFTPSNSVSSINSTLNTLNANTQFSTNRYAVLFAPGTYTGVEAEVGYYESVAGLGETPSAVTISNGYLTSNQTDSNGNITTNFWRSLENMYITPPSGDVLQWGVSQGAPFRRMYVNGALELTNTNCGYASGGFTSDTVVTGNVNSCSQQQWYTRNSSIGSWSSGVWNMVFSGVTGAPTPNYPTNSYTVLPTTPVSREKPFLYVDSGGNYWVFSPGLRTNSSGTSWSGGGLGTGTSLPISSFFIATPSSTLAQINAALASGENLILTPGIYQYSGAINVTNANTVVLGLGYADLVPQAGTAAITVADVSGVQVAGLLVDAGPVNSPVLFEVGVAGGSRVSHASDPTSINDVFFRIGGATAGTATTSLEIDSDNVILDNIWAWRADHGADASWTGNVANHGLVVDGDNVTALGLAVEHYEQNQVVWNGQGGETIFYQSEMPYDVPSEAAWMDGSIYGYASYYVSPTVTTHTAYGLGVYSYFDLGVDIIANSGITVPIAAGVTVTDAVTVFLNGSGQITYTITSDSPTVDNAGTVADSASYISYVTSYGGSNGSCSTAPGAPGGLSATATSSSQISLSWGASSAGSSCTVSYNVFRSTTSGFTPSSSNQIASSLAGTTYADSGLAASTTYYYVVEAVDAAGSSAPSPQASAETLGGSDGSCSTVPSAPAGLTATASSSSEIGLAWSAVTPPVNCTISSYNLYASTTNGFTPGSGNLISTVSSGTTYSDTGLSAATTYYFVVEAVDAFGNSVPSSQQSATTQAAASGSEIVAIAAGGPAESNSSGGDYGFVADEYFNGGGDNAVTSSTINLTQPGVNAAPMAVYQHGRSGVFAYTIPGLTAGAQYTVLLHFAETYFTAAGDREFNVAINGTSVLTNLDIYATVGANAALLKTFTATANSSGDIVIAFTLGAANQPLLMGIEVRSSASSSCSTVPSAPTGLTATASSSSAIGLSWSAVTAPANCTLSSYKVYGSTASGFTPSSSNLLGSPTGTTFSSTGLAASTTYYYVVEAADADGNSAASSQASAKTAAASCSAVPSAPTGLTATASSSSVIGLTWTAVTPPANCTISSYNLYGSTTTGFTPSSSNLLTSATGTSYSNTGLTASTTYYYVVEAVDADGTSTASAQQSATTQATSGAEIVAIAAGGPAESNATGGDSSFVADEDYSGGGDNQVTTATINLTQPGANAAPMAVYQHGRSGIFTYTIPGLTAGTQYTVLLHFAETYFTAAGDREFNVAINGTSVLSNLDVFAIVGANAALIKTFTATANSSGDIVIAFTDGAANQPLLMGIEVR
jgi:fibronectin type 3 domain-containing protein